MVLSGITDHEATKSHNSSVMALFDAQSEKDIETLLNVEMVNDRKRAIQDNILVLQRILAVIKFLGKQALSFRGHRYESMYTLDDKSVDHGNFLELILLISQFDVPLNNHIHKVIDASKKRHDSLERKGMLSKTTVNKILQGILNSLKSKIVEEIGDRRFSVQMDSTQDTAAIDQETTVLRYVVGEEVKERLFSVQNVMDASASGIFQMLKGNLEGHGLKMENIVGESFDGASNMHGQFISVQKRIKDVLLQALHGIKTAPNVNSKATYDASALLAKLCQFDIFLTAFLLLFLQYLMRSIRLFANKRIRLAFRLDYRYSLNASAFSNLFLVYEYLLTLSFTQVSCERAFSKLKFIKTRLCSARGFNL